MTRETLRARPLSPGRSTMQRADFIVPLKWYFNNINRNVSPVMTENAD